GFPVAKTGRTITCPSSSFLPAPNSGLIGGKKVVTGIIKRENTFIPVMDLDSILDMISPAEGMESLKDDNGSLPSYPGKRVLIAEDSKIILKKLSQVFTEMGFTVDMAENGADALKFIEKNVPYDLIFTDIEMPLLDGITLARKIKAKPQYSLVPILFNSALSNPALIHDIEDEKLGRYIVKYDADLILAEVTAAMSKK